MQRARAALVAAILVVLSVGGVVAASGAALVGLVVAPAVSWPTATLLISEVQTGGASASDEFVEVTNASAGPVDLAGLEVAYVTSTGGTVTRKAVWTSTRTLDPGRHLVIANASGIYGPLADATYSGGFAATGGSVVLRVVGGAPIDAVGWGDATNAFVEGSAAAAPAPSVSIERLPGGVGGNTVDTNVNAADFFVQSAPNPQNTSAPPAPAPAPSATAAPSAPVTPSPSALPSATPIESAGPSLPSGSPTPDPTTVPPPSVDPSPSAEPSPTVTPSPSATESPLPPATPQPSGPAPSASVTPQPSEPAASPSPSPSATPSPGPDASPSPEPSPTAEPTPAATPLPSPTPTPAPSSIAILDARSLPDGSTATVEGVLTTALGALEGGRVGFVQDMTAGIAIYLADVPAEPWQAGTLVRVTGILDQRYEQRTLRVPLASVVAFGSAPLPAPVGVSTGAVGEYLEGTRAVVEGTTVGAPSAFSDGLGILVDDGSGQVRVIVGPDALAGQAIPAGTTVVAIGPVGQRDSSGTGLAGYRIHATSTTELAIVAPPPSPTPSPTSPPGPTPSPTSNPTPTPAPSATPDPTVAPSPAPSSTPGGTISIAAARSLPVGARVSVVGVVTAEPGRLGTPPLLAIADATAGIVVRLPDGAPRPLRGAAIAVSGPLADPYGQIEIRPDPSGFVEVGFGTVPMPLRIGGGDLGEGTEARLVELVGTAKAAARRATSGDISVDLIDGSGIAARVLADGSSGIEPGDIPVGASLRIVGIVGQHASRKGALDGYRVWLRDRGDVSAAGGVGGIPTDADPAPNDGRAALVSPIAALRTLPDGTRVTIEAVVTATGGLLDGDGRRIVVQDASAAIEVLLPAASTSPGLGARLRVQGILGHAWGAPRIAATEVEPVAATGPRVAPRDLGGGPGSDEEWLLVRVAGRVVHVERMGSRWRADVLVGKERVLVTALAASGVASTAVVDGRDITLVGIVRRPYPTATDRRFALLPRGPWDIAVGPAIAAAESGRPAASSGVASPTLGTSLDATPDTDLAILADRIGRSVRVGGLVVDVVGETIRIDDGTAIGVLVLRGQAAAFTPLLRAGEAISVRGTVTIRDGAPVVDVSDPAGVARVGALGESLPVVEGPSSTSETATGEAVRSADLIVEPAPGGVALVLVGAVSAVVALARRRLVHRHLLAVATARLATLRESSR